MSASVDRVELRVEGLEDAVVVLFEGREGINVVGTFVVELLCPDTEIDPADLIGKGATVGVVDASGAEATFHLMVVRAAHRGQSGGKERYRLELAPNLARLGLRVNHVIFQDKTAQEIIAEVLKQGGVTAAHVKWRLAGQYAKRVYTVQYSESDWDFVARLCSEEGINFWLDQNDDGPFVVFGDQSSSHEGIEGPTPVVPFEDKSGLSWTGFAFHKLKRRWSLTPTKVALRDINVQNPDVPVDGDAGEGALEIFEYPSHVMIPEAAKARAKVRLEQHRSRRTTLEGESGNARLRPGRVVVIEGAADAAFLGRFLITQVEHRLEQSSRDHAGGTGYQNRVTLVPFGPETPYRPEVPSNPPIVEHLESAIVTGASGEEIHVDDLGRIKVRFLWDRSGVRDDKSSRWVRHLQLNLVAPQMLPRVGWEVPVIYENGNPDRPFVLGKTYNGAMLPPYPMPAQKATTTFRSGTSPGHGSAHEIRMVDDGGSEETMVHATKDQTVAVGGTHSVTVAGNRLDTVLKGQALTVDGAQSISVGGNQMVVVGADAGLSVEGARAESVGGSETIGVKGTYNTVVTGGFKESVGALYFLRCNEYNATVQGSFTQAIGGVLSTTSGLGTHQAVSGARTEVVGGARVFTAASVYADSTMGRKSIVAGAAAETAGGPGAFNAKARIAYKAGGVMSLEGSGPVIFEAASITVKASSLTANGGSTMTMSGALQSTATIKLDAPSVTKKGGAEVES